MMLSDPLWRWNATTLTALVRSRALSAVEVTRAALDRLAAVNPRVCAVTRVTEKDALDTAAKVDAEIARGRDPGPLAGVPITIKQNVDQTGCATDNGVVAWRELIATDDSPVVRNLKAAGAVILGRTNTPAFSLRWDTDNALHGATYNPFDRARVPGGSSGGASAALASGIGAIAHGNDLGGSVRYPAYCCGLVGLRPTFGRIAAFNPTAPAERPYLTGLMSVQGPLARSVDDLELALAAMSRPDARDPWWTAAPLASSRDVLPASLRVAVLDAPDDFGGAAIDPAVSDAVRTAADWLADAGFVVERVRNPGFGGAAEWWRQVLAHELRVFMRALIEKEGDDGGRRSIGYLMEDRPPLAGEDYARKLPERTRLMREWSLFLERYPLVLSPASLEPPLERSHDTGVGAAGKSRYTRVLDAMAPQTAVPALGLPAISAPTGLASGMPMGVQLMAARFREDLCFAAARAIELRAPRIVPIDPV